MTGQGEIIKFKTLAKMLGRERCNFEGIDGNLLQNIVFFKFFALFLHLRG